MQAITINSEADYNDVVDAMDEWPYLIHVQGHPDEEFFRAKDMRCIAQKLLPSGFKLQRTECTDEDYEQACSGYKCINRPQCTGDSCFKFPTKGYWYIESDDFGEELIGSPANASPLECLRYVPGDNYLTAMLLFWEDIGTRLLNKSLAWGVDIWTPEKLRINSYQEWSQTR